MILGVYLITLFHMTNSYKTSSLNSNLVEEKSILSSSYDADMTSPPNSMVIIWQACVSLPHEKEDVIFSSTKLLVIGQ